jgi:hypothetical protein
MKRPGFPRASPETPNTKQCDTAEAFAGKHLEKYAPNENWAIADRKPAAFAALDAVMIRNQASVSEHDCGPA